MKFVLLGACVPLDIASVAHNCKGNPLKSRSHPEHILCALWLISPGVCRMEQLQRNGPKFLLPGTQEECSPRLWHQQRKTRSQSHWDKELFLVPRGVSVSLGLINPQPQLWVSVEPLAHVTGRCSKALYSRILFHPFSQFRKMSPWKELEQDNFFLLLTFCCALSWV